MVLAKLADYEHRFGGSSGEMRPTGYEEKPVRWVIELDKEGKPIGGSLALALTSQSGGQRRGRGRDPGKTMLVPHIGRSSENDKPKLLADDDEWVFGVVRKPDDPRRARLRHEAFLALLGDCAAKTATAEVQAVLCFLQSLGADVFDHLPPEMAPKELIAFRVDGQLVSDLPAVREFWGRVFEQKTRVSKRMRKSGGGTGTAGLVTQCLVCGRTGAVAATHPVMIAGIPGGRSTLVSFNAEAFESYGLGQSYNAPVCVDCAQAYARGLNRLLAAAETHLRIGNVVYAFWTREPTAQLPVMQRLFSAPKPDEVGDLLAAFKGGAAATRPETLRDRANAFYAAGFTSHQGRAVMLSWLETTVDVALRNLARYFRLQIIPPLYPHQQPFFSVYQLVASLLPKRRRREQAEIDARALAAIVEVALRGGPLPDWPLSQATRRNRAEQHVPPARAALIQLALASQEGNSNEREEALNTQTRESPAFLCGRLLAVLEWAQREAIGNPNTTLVDRFYGSASSSPASVFGTLFRNAQDHLGKLRREKRGLYVTIERQLEEILPGLEEFPRVLTPKDQAVFALGYYYQRAGRGRRQADADTEAGAADQ